MQAEEEIGKLFNLNERHKIALSYSRVSDFDKNGDMSLVKRTYVENDGTKIGSLTDDLLNDYINGTHLFDELYYTYNGTKPTATLGKLADIIVNNTYEYLPTVEEVLTIIKENGFWSSIKKKEVIIKKFDHEDFWEYIKAQFASKEKTLATMEEIIWAQDLVDTLLSHENSRHIFDNNNEKINQIRFEYDYEDFTFRGILDILTIDHENKTVRMIDLKTGSNPVSEFVSHFIKWRYFIQEAVYSRAMDKIKKDFGIEDYKSLPFQFLYISRFEKLPFVFEVGEKWHEAALKGFVTNSGRKYRGLEELLEEIKWHTYNKVYDCSRELYEAKGFMDLNDEFITIK